MKKPTLFLLFVSLTFALSGYSQSVKARVDSLNERFLDYEFADLKKAADALQEALALAKKANYKEGLAATHIHLGYFAEDRGNYPEALKHYYTALKINERIHDTKAVAACYNNIGNVYNSQANYPEALKNYFAYLKISQKSGFQKGISISYNNIGIIYEKQGDYRKALNYYLKSLKIDEAIGEPADIAISRNNIGSAYAALNDYKAALDYHFSALKIQEQIGDRSSIPATCSNIGFALFKQKDYAGAGRYLNKARELAREIGDKEYLSLVYSGLAKLDSARGDFKQAYTHHLLFIQYRDSLDNEESRAKTIQNQLAYAFEKKEAATKANQAKKDIIAKAALKQKEQQRNYFIAGFALVGLLALFILRGYRQKQKANVIILEQKAEVEQSKLIIEEKNKDITDSINYAKRIQHAMLPGRNEILRTLPESFVLFKPKDIVSGDFYFHYHADQSVFIAAADCTGHGVPGAFMSLIGAEKLQEAVTTHTGLSAMLKHLNKGIKTSLRQSGSEESTRDGMDIALCSIDRESGQLHYAGANRPLWIIRKGQNEVEEIKATKKAIGGLTADDQHFDSHQLQLQPGDAFYICTDGYADQFGGSNGKKLMTKRLKEILLGIQHKTMPEQQEHLDAFIENWTAGCEQLDDILVMGVRI